MESLSEFLTVIEQMLVEEYQADADNRFELIYDNFKYFEFCYKKQISPQTAMHGLKQNHKIQLFKK